MIEFNMVLEPLNVREEVLMNELSLTLVVGDIFNIYMLVSNPIIVN